MGTSHLPQDQIGTSRTQASTATCASVFVEEASRWLPEEEGHLSRPGPVPSEAGGPAPATGLPDEFSGARILVVDDNADMREYLARLLARRWAVEAVVDGVAALAALRRERFSLILSDVMMPQLDGFGLLQAVRADPALQALPVILLSARAGEESRIEGLRAGADDYLIKPFSAREVVARVETHLKLSARRRLVAENAALVRLHEVSARLVSEDALPTLLQAVVDAAITVTGAAMGTLQLYDKATGSLYLAAHQGFQRPFLDHFQVVNGSCAASCGAASRRGERVIVEDVAHSPIFRDTPSMAIMAAAGVLACQSTPLRARDGTLLGVFSTHWREVHRPDEGTLRILDLLAREVADLIEHRQREAALRESQAQLLEAQHRLQAIMQAVPVGISFSEDPTCRRITGNPAVLVQFEMKSEDNLSASAPDPAASGRQVRYFRDGEEIPDAELPLQRAVAENREIPPLELEVLLPSGRHWFTEASGAPIRDAHGQVIGGVAVTVDITERKRAEDALREADRRKDEFLATLAHELRNPLAPLRNALHVLRLSNSDKSVAERLHVMMERQVHHLVRLVDDLMEVSRITRGKIELKKEPVELAAIVRSALDTSQPLIEAARPN